MGVGRIEVEQGQSHTDVPSLSKDNPQEEEEKENGGSNPAIGCKGSGHVKVGLVLLERHHRESARNIANKCACSPFSHFPIATNLREKT